MQITITIKNGDEHLVKYLQETVAPRLIGKEACISIGSDTPAPEGSVPFPGRPALVQREGVEPVEAAPRTTKPIKIGP